MRWSALLLLALAGCSGSSGGFDAGPYSFPGCGESPQGSCATSVFDCAQAKIAAEEATSCTTDADCVLVDLQGTCAESCEAVTIGKEGEFRTRVSNELDKLCASTNCGTFSNACATAVAICDAGACATFIPPPPFCQPPAPADVCTQSNCYTDWSEVLLTCDPDLALFTCGQIGEAEVRSMDQPGAFYFDLQSGKPLAQTLDGQCQQGDPSFTLPLDCGDAGEQPVSCADAGT